MFQKIFREKMLKINGDFTFKVVPLHAYKAVPQQSVP